jgi:ubiquitin-activating enzyme E1 C
VCGSEPLSLSVVASKTFQEFMDDFVENHPSQLKKPSFRSSSKSIYMQNPPPLEEATRPNLKKKMGELLNSQDKLFVTDASLPLTLTILVTLE